jgi:hypothetical protein
MRYWILLSALMMAGAANVTVNRTWYNDSTCGTETGTDSNPIPIVNGCGFTTDATLVYDGDCNSGDTIHIKPPLCNCPCTEGDVGKYTIDNCSASQVTGHFGFVIVTCALIPSPTPTPPTPPPLPTPPTPPTPLPTNCSDGQYIKDGNCTGCKTCPVGREHDHNCDGTHDTDSCSKLKWYIWFIIALVATVAIVVICLFMNSLWNDESNGNGNGGLDNGFLPRGFHTINSHRI